MPLLAKYLLHIGNICNEMSHDNKFAMEIFAVKCPTILCMQWEHIFAMKTNVVIHCVVYYVV